MRNILADYAVRTEETRGRKYAENNSNSADAFQIDRERVIHSKAFRRLADKTQVFLSSEGDHFRTRLTHTLEVAQISRKLARRLNLNEDLAEVIALAHDLGHTPFGHAGETALNQILTQKGFKFEHNEQSKRVVEDLERFSPNFNGLNLSIEVLDGLIKHKKAFDPEQNKFLFLTSLEAQLVNLADEIAYTVHDIDDGLRSKIISEKNLSKLAIWIEAETITRKNFASDIKLEEILPLILVNLVEIIAADLVQNTLQNLAVNQIHNLENVQKSRNTLVSLSSEMRGKLAPLRHCLYQELYFAPEVLEAMKFGQEVIRGLFDYLENNFQEIPEEFLQHQENTPQLLIIKDYIAGMTDGFAINLWEAVH